MSGKGKKKKDFRQTWHGPSRGDDSSYQDIEHAREQQTVRIKDFRDPEIGLHLDKLSAVAKKCKKLWAKKFSSAKERKKEEKHQGTFTVDLKKLISEFEELKKILPSILITGERQTQIDPVAASPLDFRHGREQRQSDPVLPGTIQVQQWGDNQQAMGGFKQTRRDQTLSATLPFQPRTDNQEFTSGIKQSRRDPNEDIIKQFQQRLDDQDTKLRDTEDRCRRAEDRVRALSVEKEDLMTRLSQVAGSKLRDNNPAITDLSDPNRPIKLVEKISELYDNEWTDGMEALEKSGMTEPQSLKVLLSIFTMSYENCKKIAISNIDDLQRKLSNPTKRQDGDRMTKFPSHVLKQLKDTRKIAAEYQVGIPAIIKEVDSVLGEKHGHGVVQSCRKYINKCVEYSWYMSIQDPPLEIEYQYTVGGKFEHDKMRAYTMSGSIIQYVVWPAIYLHKNGAMLSKAVVQGQSGVSPARAIAAGSSRSNNPDWSQTRRTTPNDDTDSRSANRPYARQSDFNRPILYKSIKTETDRDNFAKSEGEFSGVSNSQHPNYQGERDTPNNSRLKSPAIQTERERYLDEPRIPTASSVASRNPTPESCSRHVASTPPGHGTSTPPRGGGVYAKKGQGSNFPHSTQKLWNASHATTVSVPPDTGNRNFSQTSHGVISNRDTRAVPQSHSQSTYYGGSHNTAMASGSFETNL